MMNSKCCHVNAQGEASSGTVIIKRFADICDRKHMRIDYGILPEEKQHGVIMAQVQDVNAENISAANFLQPIVTCLYLAVRSDFNRTLV